MQEVVLTSSIPRLRVSNHANARIGIGVRSDLHGAHGCPEGKGINPTRCFRGTYAARPILPQDDSNGLLGPATRLAL